jgi:SRSO17 transposase
MTRAGRYRFRDIGRRDRAGFVVADAPESWNLTAAGAAAVRGAFAGRVGGGRHRLPKDGRCSVGVQRQYSGTLGKTANCQLGVSVNAVTEQASCPLDWRLSLPEGWDEEAMAARRAACHLPERVHHRPKWQLVLDMLDELAGWELRPPVVLADSGYGEVGAFRGGLDARQIPYVVEVRADTSAYPEQARPTVPPSTGRVGGPARVTTTSPAR